MRGKYLFILLILCIIGIPVVFADYSQIIEYNMTAGDAWSMGSCPDNYNEPVRVSRIYFPDISKYRDVSEFEYTPYESRDFAWYSNGGVFDSSTVKTFTVAGDTGSLTGAGTCYILNNGGDESLRFVFDSWDIGTSSGGTMVTISFSGAYGQLRTYSNTDNTIHVNKSYSLQGGPGLTEANKYYFYGLNQVSYSSEWKANLTIHSTEYPNYITSDVLFDRNVGGIDYASSVEVVKGSFIYLPLTYAASGTSGVSVQSYPFDVIVRFGYPDSVYNHRVTYYANASYIDIPDEPIPNPTPTIPISNSGCGMNIELSLSKYANIFPYENITASLSIDDTSNLTSGSKITYVIDTFNLNSPLVIATFTNISGTWHAYKNDLGIFSDYDTTLSDALSENIRFSDAGYYTVSAYVDTPTGCYVYDTVSANINPTSQVNVDFYFRDAVSGDLVGFVAATISNVGITGNVSYYGNPIGIAASRYDNISIYCDHEGYETKFFYYTVPQPPYGNVLNVPIYLTPLEAPIIYADNTVLSVNVKSAESGEGLSNAYVSADILGVECDSGWTDGNGFVSLIVPFHSGYTLLSTGRFPYNSESRYLSLNNATSYSVDVYLSYAGTPIVTPTPSYNYTPTLTPTTTDTPMPTSTVISTPLLYVHVWDADGGMAYPISSAIVTIYDGDEVDQTYKGAIMYTAYTDTAGNIEPLQIGSNSAFWASISKSGYYTQIQRYRMTTGTESHIYVPLKRVGASVTVVTTQPTLVLPTPGGTGIQGGFIGWILEYLSEWFGVDNGTARILLALLIIMCSSVFVGGSLAGFGSGAGAGMGALIGGMFAFIAMCYVQFLPFWLLPIGIAFVGMAFFVWNRQEK